MTLKTPLNAIVSILNERTPNKNFPNKRILNTIGYIIIFNRLFNNY